jgi:hypothetical protein
MLNTEKWKRLSGPLYREEFILTEKAQNFGLTEEEQERLKYLKKLLGRFLSRFLKHSHLTGELPTNDADV